MCTRQAPYKSLHHTLISGAMLGTVSLQTW